MYRCEHNEAAKAAIYHGQRQTEQHSNTARLPAVLERLQLHAAWLHNIKMKSLCASMQHFTSKQRIVYPDRVQA